ncbi:MAG: pentapeptide repeat-containing protein, partial [Rivularia sp. (in: cyanobacteria)]
MIKKLLTALTIVAPLFFASSVTAENPQHVQKLLKTGECVACDLSGANLR